MNDIMVEVESIRVQTKLFWVENQKGPPCNKRHRTNLNYVIFFFLKNKGRMTTMVGV